VLEPVQVWLHWFRSVLACNDLPALLLENKEKVIFQLAAEKVAQRKGPIFAKQALITWPKVSFLSGTLRRRCVTVLLRNSKYCSWEPGDSRQAGALAVVRVAKLLCNSDANSMERKEEDLGGGGSIYREPEWMPRIFTCWDLVGNPRFRSLLGFVKEFWYCYSCPCIAQHLCGRNKGRLGKI